MKSRSGASIASKTGMCIGLALAVALALLLWRGTTALFAGSMQALRAFGDTPVAEEEFPVNSPTMPPYEEPFVPEVEDSSEVEKAAQVEVPVVMTPEELARIAEDTTPPPDAPIG